MEEFFGSAQRHGSQLQEAGLADAILAQDYQDRTSQINHRVIALVQEVEGGLVKLMRISGQRVVTPQTKWTAEREPDCDRRGYGPVFPGRAKTLCMARNEADELLSSLGF